MLRALLLVLVCALAIIIAPRVFGYGLLSVHGGSMGDALPNGTLVITEAAPAQDVENGDVIVVRAQGAATPVIHRVVALEQGNGQTLATTKGDANTSADPSRFPLSNSVTVPAFSAPYLGFLLTFVTTPLGWLLGIALPATLISFLMIRNIWELDATSNPGKRQAPVDADPLEHWTHKYGFATAQLAPPAEAAREQTPLAASHATPAATPEAQTEKPMPPPSGTRPDHDANTHDHAAALEPALK